MRASGRRGPRGCTRRCAAPLAAAVVAIFSAACASSVSVILPGGAGRSEPAAVDWWRDARSHCGGLDTWSAEVAVAGRVRGQRLRGKALVGSTSAGHLRLEALAPFGGPVLLLVASEGRATVYLPREGRALRDAPVADVLDALAGLPISAADLHALFTGCVAAAPDASAGRSFDDGWVAVTLREETTGFLRQSSGRWRIEGARLGRASVGYAAFDGQAPREMRISSAAVDQRGEAQLRLRLSQVEENVPLSPEAFRLEIPPATRPLGLDELRAEGLAIGGR